MKIDLGLLIKVLCSDAFHSPVHIVYQRGKTASQTVEATLRNAGLSGKIFRTHFMSCATIRKIKNRFKCHIFSETQKESMRRQIKIAELLRHILFVRKFEYRLCGRKTPKINLIVGVREPVGLMLASLFENHKVYFKTLEHATTQTVRDVLLGSSGAQEELYQYRDEVMDLTQNWFDEELKAVTGLDVYDQPFPHERGYVIRENEWVRALIYRLENIRDLPLMLEEFLGRKMPELARCNLGTEKEYSAAYDAVKKNLALPDGYLDKVYGTKFSRHFYTTREIENFKWLWGIRAACPCGDHE